MSAKNNDEALTAETLSALADGEGDAAALSRACEDWRDSGSVRADWHAFHLIGDVLRSQELASTPRRDAEFLARLRARLALEPVVLAPQPLAAPPAPEVRTPTTRVLRPRRWSWMAPAAVAAGFAAVAAVLVVTRAPAPAAVETAAASPVLPAAVVAAESIEPEAQVLNGKMLRDARLNRYLAAHKQFAGSSALGVPSSFLRSATTDAANR